MLARPLALVINAGFVDSVSCAWRAKELIASPLPLEHIVTRCGDEDVSSFRKLFSRQVGMTPREYRSRFHSTSAASTER